MCACLMAYAPRHLKVPSLSQNVCQRLCGDHAPSFQQIYTPNLQISTQIMSTTRTHKLSQNFRQRLNPQLALGIASPVADAQPHAIPEKKNLEGNTEFRKRPSIPASWKPKATCSFAKAVAASCKLRGQSFFGGLGFQGLGFRGIEGLCLYDGSSRLNKTVHEYQHLELRIEWGHMGTEQSA